MRLLPLPPTWNLSWNPSYPCPCLPRRRSFPACSAHHRQLQLLFYAWPPSSAYQTSLPVPASRHFIQQEMGERTVKTNKLQLARLIPASRIVNEPNFPLLRTYKICCHDNVLENVFTLCNSPPPPHMMVRPRNDQCPAHSSTICQTGQSKRERERENHPWFFP